MNRLLLAKITNDDFVTSIFCYPSIKMMIWQMCIMNCIHISVVSKPLAFQEINALVFQPPNTLNIFFAKRNCFTVVFYTRLIRFIPIQLSNRNEHFIIKDSDSIFKLIQWIKYGHCMSSIAKMQWNSIQFTLTECSKC